MTLDSTSSGYVPLTLTEQYTGVSLRTTVRTTLHAGYMYTCTLITQTDSTTVLHDCIATACSRPCDAACKRSRSSIGASGMAAMGV